MAPPPVPRRNCTRTRINQVNHSCGRNSCATTLPGASQPVVAPYRTRIDVVRRSSHIVAVHTGGVNKGVNTRDTIMDPSRLRLRYHQWYALQTTPDAAAQQTKARVTGSCTHPKRIHRHTSQSRRNPGQFCVQRHPVHTARGHDGVCEAVTVARSLWSPRAHLCATTTVVVQA